MSEFDVVDLGPTDHVAVDEAAPKFRRPLVADEYWEDRSLSALVADGPLALVFTPMVGSFVTRYIFEELSDRGVGTEETGDPNDPAVLGVTISSPYEISRFVDENTLSYRLFSDPANAVAESYGVVHDLDGMTGIAEPRPSVFVLDREGIVEYAWVATEWPSFPEYDELEVVLGDT